MKKFLFLLFACLMLTACSRSDSEIVSSTTEEYVPDKLGRLVLTANRTNFYNDLDDPLIDSFAVDINGFIEYVDMEYFAPFGHSEVTRIWKLSKEDFDRLYNLAVEARDIDVLILDKDITPSIQTEYWDFVIYDEHEDIVFDEKYILVDEDSCLGELKNLLEAIWEKRWEVISGD